MAVVQRDKLILTSLLLLPLFMCCTVNQGYASNLKFQPGTCNRTAALLFTVETDETTQSNVYVNIQERMFLWERAMFSLWPIGSPKHYKAYL